MRPTNWTTVPLSLWRSANPAHTTSALETLSRLVALRAPEPSEVAVLVEQARSTFLTKLTN